MKKTSSELFYAITTDINEYYQNSKVPQLLTKACQNTIKVAICKEFLIIYHNIVNKDV